MKTLLLSAAFAALALGANAQTTVGFGAEAGVNLSNVRTTVGSEKNTSSTKAGLRAGITANIGFGGQLAVQPGLFFSQKGGKQETALTDVGGSYTQTNELVFNYVELPVNVVYHFNNEQTGFFLSAGAYGAMAVSGSDKESFSGTVPAGKVSSDEKIKIGSAETDQIRRLDLGFQAGAGYQLKMGLLIRAQYMLGAQNILSYNNSDFAMRNGAIALTLGYRFGGR